MRYAVILENIVENITLADPEYAASQGWIACPDNVNIDWIYKDGEFFPPPPDPEKAKEQNKAIATQLLSDTDWSTLPDVTDTTKNPYLVNSQEFVDYRNQLRQIAVNPPVIVDPWPVKPTEQWSS